MKIRNFSHFPLWTEFGALNFSFCFYQMNIKHKMTGMFQMSTYSSHGQWFLYKKTKKMLLLFTPAPLEWLQRISKETKRVALNMRVVDKCQPDSHFDKDARRRRAQLVCYCGKYHVLISSYQTQCCIIDFPSFHPLDRSLTLRRKAHFRWWSFSLNSWSYIFKITFTSSLRYFTKQFIYLHE